VALADAYNVAVPTPLDVTELEPVQCPFCDARSAELVSLFGSQLLFSQYRCAVCGSYFEGLRRDRRDSEPVAQSVEEAERGWQ
jgi:transposase-like protein